MLYIMPVMLGFFTYQVNAGIGLYWVISNIVGIAQQYLINKFFIVKEHLQHKDGESSEETKKK
jgi:YidC/Oxa1 family membrane protein insertase